MPITDAMRARHVVRQYLSTPLPDDVVERTRARSLEAYERLTGYPLELS